jgi:hypothetical protein
VENHQWDSAIRAVHEYNRINQWNSDMSCSKSLDFASSQPSPFAYYKLEEASGSAVDSIAAYNFLNTGNPAQLVAGKINLAYDLTDHGAGGVAAQTASTASVDFSAVSFTIRMWVKQNGLFAGSFLNDDNFNWNIANGLDGKIHCGTNLMNTLPFEITTTNINDGNFHRVILLQDTPGKKIYLKLDNNATATYAFATAGVPVAGASRWDLNGFSGLILDEVAIWKGIVLTEPQMLFDWNGGVGVTWPW